MDIVDRIVALGARDTLPDLGRIHREFFDDLFVLPLAAVVDVFGAGEAGLHALQEIAEDNNWAVRVDSEQVAIVGL